MRADLASEASELLNETVIAAEVLQGGGLSQVILLRLASGVEAVVKNGPAPKVEASMLQAIYRAGAPAPRVLAVSEAALVLERLSEGGALEPAAGDLGAALARLHGATGERYGWAEDYAFGDVSILNGFSDDWVRFWAEKRLMSEVDRLPAPLSKRLEALAARLGEIAPSRPRASLCHGDLWSGNVMAHGGVVSGLIDPAAYYGHGELDLAMLSLFGSVGPAFMEAYGPLEPGWERRRAVYQIWPAIVHLRLFGAGYRSLLERLLAEAGF